MAFADDAHGEHDEHAAGEDDVIDLEQAEVIAYLIVRLPEVLPRDDRPAYARDRPAVHGEICDGGDQQQDKRPRHAEQTQKNSVLIQTQLPVLPREHRREQDGERYQNAVVQAVQQVFHRRAVPRADDEKHDGHPDAARQRPGDMRPRLRAAETAFAHSAREPLHGLRHGDGVEEIASHPRPERDVPAPPVVGERHGEIRLPEVLGQVDTEYLRRAPADVDAAGEVGVELQKADEKPERDRRAVIQRDKVGVFKQRPHRDGGAVGDHELFEEPPQHQLAPVLEACEVKRVRRAELRRKLAVHADRPLDDLREERHEQRIPRQIPLRPHRAVRHVDDVARGLERVERYAHRHDERPRRRGEAEQRRKTRRGEAVVFEYGPAARTRRRFRSSVRVNALRRPRSHTERFSAIAASDAASIRPISLAPAHVVSVVNAR